MLEWIAQHPGWIGMGLGIFIGMCIGFLVVGLINAARERNHFEGLDL